MVVFNSWYSIMLSLQSIVSIRELLTLVMAYFLLVTIAGTFKAWVAKMVGDDTPEQMGFLTFNPLVHTSPIGFAFLLIFKFGWGKHIPINPYNITGRFRAFKLMMAYLSDSFANFAMAVASLLFLFIYFGPKVLAVFFYKSFASLFPEASSFAISLGLIVSALIYLNIILASLNFIISGFSFILTMFSDRFTIFGRYRDIIIILIPMFAILFFIRYLEAFTFGLVSSVSILIARIFGIL